MKRLFLLLLFTCISFIISAQPATFSSRGVGGGGALFFPSINPDNDDEFYVSCDMSELFHTIDFGTNYDQVHFDKLQVFNTSTYEFTSNPILAYTNFNDGNNGYPVKTLDGGITWNQLPGYNTNTYGKVYKMSVNYNYPNELIIGAYGDILFSNDHGQTFALVKHASNMGAGIIIGGVFWDGPHIYIGTNEGIIHSFDSGVNFNFMPVTGMAAGQVIWSFAGARSGPLMRFICIATNSSGTYNGMMPWEYYNVAREVYTMDNANGTWVPSSTGINFSNDFIMYAGMARNDPSVIYLGGNDNALSAPLVFRSSDGGLTWNKIFNTTNNANIQTGWEGYQGDKNWSWSETCFGISVAPGNSAKVIFSSFSNVHVSSDSGNHWKQAYVDVNDQHPAGSPTPQKQTYRSIGLENTTCWQVHWQNTDTVFGCFSDIGLIRSSDGGQSWGYTYSGFSVNSVYRMLTTTNGKMYAACSNIHDMYQSTRLTDALLDANDGQGKIVYSTDNGSVWNNLHVFNHPVYWLASGINDTSTLYASVIHYGGVSGLQQGGIYVTHDLYNGPAATWTKLPNPPRTEGHPAVIHVLTDGNIVCTFSGRRNPGGTFTPSSGVFIYNPLTATWSDVSDPGMHYWTKDLIIDPSDSLENTWFVCVFSGWGGAPNGLGGLYKTTDRGNTWAKLTGSQFDRVTSVTFNPNNDIEAFLTTETQGLWVSHDMHAQTPTWSLVQSYPFRQPERVFFNPFENNELWVSSFGNGMKTGSMLNTGVSNVSVQNSDVTIFPNPFTNCFRFDLKESNTLINGNKELFIRDMPGKIIHSIALTEQSTEICIGDLKKGVYLLTYGDYSQILIKE